MIPAWWSGQRQSVFWDCQKTKEAVDKLMEIVQQDKSPFAARPLRPGQIGDNRAMARC